MTAVRALLALLSQPDAMPPRAKSMASLMIRNLDDDVKRELRRRAAERGVSMEQEARDRLAESLGRARRRKSIFDDLTRLGIKPEEPFDQKAITDAMWDESFR